jgi:hypothetical protein
VRVLVWLNCPNQKLRIYQPLFIMLGFLACYPFSVGSCSPRQVDPTGECKECIGGPGVSDSFAVELMWTCAILGRRMFSPELRESSDRMLRVTGGRWPKNVPIPRAATEDMFTSRMARDLKIFPYGRNIAAVVSAVMEKDRQDAVQKRRAVVRIGDPFREAKKARSLPPPAAASRRRL